MRNYEVTYILDPTLGDDNVTGLMDKFKSNIANQGGEVAEVKSWGKRRLAYELAGRNEGIYVTMKFDADAAAQAELRRIMGLADEVLRTLFIRNN